MAPKDRLSAVENYFEPLLFLQSCIEELRENPSSFFLHGCVDSSHLYHGVQPFAYPGFEPCTPRQQSSKSAAAPEAASSAPREGGEDGQVETTSSYNFIEQYSPRLAMYRLESEWAASLPSSRLLRKGGGLGGKEKTDESESLAQNSKLRSTQPSNQRESAARNAVVADTSPHVVRATTANRRILCTSNASSGNDNFPPQGAGRSSSKMGWFDEESVQDRKGNHERVYSTTLRVRGGAAAASTAETAVSEAAPGSAAVHPASAAAVNDPFKHLPRLEPSLLTVERTTIPREKKDKSTLVFGQTFTDHMLPPDFRLERGWRAPRFLPYGDLAISPAASSLHYGLQGHDLRNWSINSLSIKNVRMVTGDNINNAKTIAKECGILDPDGGVAVEGPGLTGMSPAQLDEVLPLLKILARSSPNKYLLVTGLNGHGIPADEKVHALDIHTSGRWSGTPEQLTQIIRPFFQAPIPVAVAEGMDVGMATFCPQMSMISPELKTAFPDVASQIPIRGDDFSWEYDCRDATDRKQGLVRDFIEKIGPELAKTARRSSAKIVRRLRKGCHHVTSPFKITIGLTVAIIGDVAAKSTGGRGAGSGADQVGLCKDGWCISISAAVVLTVFSMVLAGCGSWWHHSGRGCNFLSLWVAEETEITTDAEEDAEGEPIMAMREERVQPLIQPQAATRNQTCTQTRTLTLTQTFTRTLTQTLTHTIAAPATGCACQTV